MNTYDTSGDIGTDLVILRRQLIQTLLDYVVAIQVLDQHDNVQAQGDDNRVYLSIVANISLNRPT